MESNDAQEQLREIERGEAAGWLEYGPTPWWHPLYFGAYAAILTFALGALDGLTQSLVLLVLTASAFVLIAWMRQVRGTWPTKNAPRELNRPLWGLIIGSVVLSGLCVAANTLLDLTAAVVLAGVLATGLTWWYGRAYARATAAARTRLA